MVAALHLLAWSAAAIVPTFAVPHGDGCDAGPKPPKVTPVKRIALGPRPYWLVDQMDEGPLKRKLASCSEKEIKRSEWSIAHRGGGTMQFPEHSHSSIMAGVSSRPLRFLPSYCPDD